MEKPQKVRYLANIYYLLLSDRQLDRIEERVFEQIARDIGAGYFEKKEARELAGQAGYEIAFPDRWSDRNRNLEDMLFAAFCNDALANAEKMIVQDFARQLGLTQQQLDIIRQETKRRYLKFRKSQ